jgi:hypothetical protein
VLVSEQAFDILKSIQKIQPGTDSDLPVIFDLKDIVSAVVLEAADRIPDLRERARQRAFVVMHDMLANTKSS